MSKMYIGNASKQIAEFVYRLPETPGARNQSVPIGGQVQITGDLRTVDIDAIVSQHTKYGLVHVDAIDRTRAFSGLCYSIDKPISSSRIEQLMRSNENVLVFRGKQIRQEAAISESNRLENELAEHDRPEGLRKFEMSVVEEARKDGPDPTFAEGIRVAKDGEGEPSAPLKRGRGRPRKAA